MAESEKMTEEQKLQEEKKSDKKGKKFNKKPVDPRYLKTLQTLQEKFPETFPASETRILKIGIHKEIKENTEINGKDIFMFLRKYCNSWKYKKAHIESAPRYGLNSITAEIVTAEQAAKKAQPKVSSEANDRYIQ